MNKKMGGVKLLQNTIQHYAWGSKTAIPELLGLPTPADEPCAELWMGAHPKAPSFIEEQGVKVPLTEFIARDPQKVLGADTAERFGNKLPFLFKVLASEKPLSIQAHPDKRAAETGFERENSQGVPLDSPKRNYKDPNHKPECLCAITEFFALCGFRAASDIRDLFTALLGGQAEELCSPLGNDGGNGLEAFFTSLINLPKERKEKIVQTAYHKARQRRDDNPAFEWIVRLGDEYPGDIGTLAPAFLNLVALKPGQALFLSAGVLHSYLQGTGIEIMANSDNVLRGGLTPKHVDPEELSRVVVFKEGAPEIIEPVRTGDCEETYPLSAEEFGLSVLRVSEKMECTIKRHGVPQILLCVEGRAEVIDQGCHETVVQRGASVFVPASSGPLSVRGKAVFYCAFVPSV